MRIAILHDWLTGMRGGERCLEEMCRLFPGSDIFSLFGQRSRISQELRSHEIHWSSFNKLPGVLSYYRHLLPLYPLAVEDLSRRLERESRRKPYDLVISISHCAVKNVRVPHGVPHLCYCLTPMRYIWDQFEAYFGDSALRPLLFQICRLLRHWDVKCSSGVTEYVAISEFVRERISLYYGRDSVVVYPPVRTDWLNVCECDEGGVGEAGQGFLCVSALVPYKNVHLIISAFNELGWPLTIVGNGPQKSDLQAMAKPNISFVSDLTDEKLAHLYRTSKALVFAAEEDFGMAPVEMQACGRPVIAFGRGGSLETVVAKGPLTKGPLAKEPPTKEQRPTGLFFYELSAGAICQAVEQFLAMEISSQRFSVEDCVSHANKFSVHSFSYGIKQVVSKMSVAKVTTGSSGEAQERIVNA